MESNQPLTVLYRDADIVAIDKPAGLLVHRSRIDTRATEFAVQRLRQQLNQPVFLIHRLDRPTSGVLLFAFHKNAARALSQQFAERRVKKTYRAIVRGHTCDQGCWEEALVEKHDRMTDHNAQPNKPAQPATTCFETLRRWEVPFSAGKYPNSRYSEVVFRPLTGRKHQIRRHCNHFAHPIVGDTSHGDRRHNRLFRERLGVSRLLLVAEKLCFNHPVTNTRIEVKTPLGSAFENAVRGLEEFNID